MLSVFEEVSEGKYQRTLTESGTSSSKKAVELKELKFKDGMPEVCGKYLFYFMFICTS